MIGFRIAEAAAAGAVCTRSMVGAALVKNDVWSLGWNMVEEGRSCLQSGCPRGLKTYEDMPIGTPYEDGPVCRATHAEEMAIRNAPFVASGATLYVTHTPCMRCARLIKDLGIQLAEPEPSK